MPTDYHQVDPSVLFNLFYNVSHRRSVKVPRIILPRPQIAIYSMKSRRMAIFPYRTIVLDTRLEQSLQDRLIENSGSQLVSLREVNIRPS